MGTVRQGPPEDLILKLLQHWPIANFIETGTCLGDTAKWAAGHFKQVHTIEFAKELYEQSTRNLAACANVKVHFGDCRTVLPGLIDSFKGPVLYWLDAHWSGSTTYGEGDECPLIQELDIIASSRNEAAILIDDARCFLAPPPAPHVAKNWPTIAEVCHALTQFPNRYVVVTEDVIVAVPDRLRDTLEAHAQAVASREWATRKGVKDTAGAHFKAGFKKLFGIKK